jgi:DNA-binding NtrC family response regulator
MIEAPALRRLLVVDPCDDCHRLLPGLRAVGWDVDSCTLENAADRTCDVGLLRLQPFHLERPEAVKELISRSGTEWIAVLNQEVLRLQNVGDFVCEWFFDFHTLPFDVSRVQVTLGRAFGMARLRGQGTIHIDQPEHELLGDSKPIRELRKLLSKLAPTESPVLIRGESGTGKELVARTLHRQSQRHSKPFVAINCGAIPEHLIQSELFGHEKGVSRRPTVAPCFLMRSAICLWNCRPTCCVFFRKNTSNVSAAASRSRLMCASWRPPTSTWKPPLRKSVFVKTCITGSMCCKW